MNNCIDDICDNKDEKLKQKITNEQEFNNLKYMKKNIVSENPPKLQTKAPRFDIGGDVLVDWNDK